MESKRNQYYTQGGAVLIHEGKHLAKRSKYIPLRLTDEERTFLRILEGGLEISEYTDKVDVTSSMYGSFWSTGVSKKIHIIERELKEMLGFISGLYVANNYALGGKMVNQDSRQDFQVNEDFFKCIFEIGRRFKIMNPDKMRTTYGKLMYIVQDAVMPGVKDFKVHAPITCVYELLKHFGGLELLEDPDTLIATQCIASTVRHEVEQVQKEKNAARQNLRRKYASKKLTADKIDLVIDSLTDSNAYILLNRHPVDMMIHYLKTYFSRDKEDPEFSLAIRYRVDGSYLSHDHATQYTFVHQSLELWREIQHEMFKLWICSDDDLLSDHSYKLEDTGQGLQRVQSAPSVSSAMSDILRKVQSRVSSWVGLSVVHLGDRDVPNALVFIDKYTQVPRILGPIVRTIERIGQLKDDPLCGQFIEEMGGVEHLRRQILCDYFKHGFDGSGDDGGSCIDGRLTSSWNWTAQIEKKDYYSIFLLCGFSGFDGSFKK